MLARWKRLSGSFALQLFGGGNWCETKINNRQRGKFRAGPNHGAARVLHVRSADGKFQSADRGILTLKTTPLAPKAGGVGSTEMKKLDKSELDRFRKVLEALAARVRLDAEAMREQSRTSSGGNGGGELSNAPLHLGDMGTEEYLYDLNTTLLANEEYIVNEARDALRRMEEGTFGVCEDCGKPIAKQRIEAIPFTRYCVKCAEVNDSTPQVNLDEGRPHVPADTLAPEGEMRENRPRRDSEHSSPRIHHGDIYAAGTAGGGTAVGGLAGTNEGHGDPNISEVQDATGSGNFDIDDDRTDPETPRSGPSGGAVGGTPARKRAT
jgi:RNA polymerase-binding transcription factor DksA